MDPLAELNDITLGNTIGIWPLAWGWWVVITVLLISLIMLFNMIRSYGAFNAVRRDAIAKAKALKTNGLEIDQQYNQLNQILKRCAVHYFNAEQVNKLHGRLWVDFLAAQLPTKHQAMFKQEMMSFVNSLYVDDKAKNFSQEIKVDYIDLAIMWLSKARLKYAKSKLTINEVRGEHV